MESRYYSPKSRTTTYTPVIEVHGYNSHNKLQAKQRASVQWLLSKSYSHQMPDDVKEPFYRDVEDQEYLKPSVVHALANAELYCLALAQIYADPNYSQLNHWGVIQALARKGVYLAEPADVALTETTLIHTSPLRMSAHMAVMEGIMSLFVKEVVTAERVVTAIKRFSADVDAAAVPKEAEQALLLWINRACQALKKRLTAETDGNDVPNFAELRELADLSDGIGLVGLLAFYCPDVVDWTRMATNEPSMADCLYNLELVHSFCTESLPHSIFHMGLEDIVYMHSSVRQNVLAFLADLFYVLEVRPAKCVRPPGRDRFSEGGKSNVLIRRQGSLQERDRTKRQTVHEVAAATSSPSAGVPSSSTSSPARRRFEPVEADESFVVHRGKSVPTLYNVATGNEGATPRSGGSRVAAIKERFNMDTKAEERGEDRTSASGPAGVPSNREWTSYAGRRSRRNSATEDNLTIENFGGSQDNLSMFGRNPDKEPATLQQSGRQPSVDSGGPECNPPPAGAPSTPAGIQHWRRNNPSQENLSEYYQMDNRDVEEQLERRSRASSPSFSSVSSATKTYGNKPTQQYVIIAANPSSASSPSGEPGDVYSSGEDTRINLARATNFAELSKLRESFGNNSAINIVYMQQDKDTVQSSRGSVVESPMTQHRRTNDSRRPASAMTIAEATSWDPQTPTTEKDAGSDEMSSAADLHGIRLKMEEKRKRIESEKRQMELMASRQREKVGKAAFLQAVSKGPKPGDGPMDYSGMESPSRSHHSGTTPQQQLPTPDYDMPEYDYQPQQHHPPYDPYRVQQQQQQPSNGMMEQPQFYLHEPSPSPRRTWGQPQNVSPGPPPPSMAYQPDYPQQRRAQWGTPQPVRAMMGHHGYMMGPQQPNYMDPHGPQSGYMMPTPPRQMENPYDAPYYGNGSQYRPQEPQQQQPYDYYSPIRQQQYQQGYPTDSPHGYNAPPQQHAYPSAADHRAPFRLHANDSGAPEPVVVSRCSPAPSKHHDSLDFHRGARATPEKTPSKPVPATRNAQRSNGLASPTVASPSGAMHTAMPTPSIDDMEPQNVSFIETPTSPAAAATIVTSGGVDEADLLPRRLRALNITSGNRTYRIPHDAAQSSPPRPALIKTFRASPSSSPASPPSAPSLASESPEDDVTLDEGVKTAKLKDNIEADRGFIITFDDVATVPKRPKPQLGAKRQPSPKKSITQSAPPEMVSVSRPSSSYNHAKVDSREGSPRRSLSSMAREGRDDHSPFTPDSRDSGFGQNSQEELKLFNMATAVPGSFPGGERSLRAMIADSDSQDEELGPNTTGLVIGEELANPDPETLDEMERKKERILLQSMKRKQQQEELRQRKELEALQRKDEERTKEEERQRKKEDEKARRAIIFEQYKIKKAMEEAEKEGRVFEMPDHMGSKSGPRMRPKNTSSGTPARPRPKTIHVDAGAPGNQYNTRTLSSSRGKRGSGTDLADNRVDAGRGSNPTLNRRGSNSSLHGDTQTPNRYRTMERGHSGRKDLSVPRYAQASSVRSSREDLYGSRNYRGSNSSLNDAESYEPYHTPLVHSGRKGSGFMTGPGSLPPGLVSKRRGGNGGNFDDGASDISSNQDYIGPRLYKQPAARSNRSNIINAVEYCVFPGVVNRDAKQRVLEEITRSENKNFLVLFRDGGCQFRALYSFNPENEEILKLYGTGPKVVNDTMFEKFFKYNSGGKCFSQVHTKHLTVTIDAFTIHPALWQGKKTSLPNKKDMTLVI